MNFSTELSIWYLPLCLAIGGAYSLVLYYKDSSFPDLPNWLKGCMGVLRFVVVSLLSILLLSPLVKTTLRQVEKPILVLALDNSQSVVSTKDSASYKSTLPKNLQLLSNELEEYFDVQRILFADKISDVQDFNSVAYSEKRTDISSVFDEVYNRYSNRNIGAMVIASDGLFNQGANPVYSSEKLKIPVYSIALGDTGIRKDLLLSKIICNKSVVLGNNFAAEVFIEARKLSGATTRLNIEEDSILIFSKSVDISVNSFQAKIPVVLEAKKKGIHHYKISIEPLPGEITTLNNGKDLIVDVLENKQKILLLANSPHPDLSVIRQTLESASSYEVVLMMADKFDGNVREFNLIILHQLPSNNNTVNKALQKLSQSGTPLWYILGSQTRLNDFNTMQSGLNINQSIYKNNEAVPLFAPEFSLFTLSDECRRRVVRFPPLLVPFGNYKMSGAAAKLLLQKQGSVNTENALLTFYNQGETRNAVLTGEGLWKWRLQEYSENSNQEGFNELFLKTIQYLSVKEEKNPFRVHHKNSFPENEPVLFDAEFYNESNELVNTQEVRMSISNSDGNKFPFNFSKTQNAYSLKAGFFAPGVYRFEATTKAGEKIYSSRGQFTIEALQAEFAETIADYNLLSLLASKHGGKMVAVNEISKLKEMISSREDVKPVVYTQNKFSDIINLKGVFILLLTLLAAEWFLRKRSGGY